MWAEPTWDFLLTFVIKIGHVFFEQHRTECLNILFNITQILPCKNCIKHAQQYFTEKSFFSIQNKTELIQFMKDYYINVNAKKSNLSCETCGSVYELVHRKKYARYNFLQMARKFVSIMEKFNGNLNKLYNIREWINNNYEQFNYF